MNRLECQVESCQHNQNHQCCLMGIQVDGPAAQDCSQTCCASFEERRAGSAQNAMGQNPTVERISAAMCRAVPTTAISAATPSASVWAAAAGM